MSVRVKSLFLVFIFFTLSNAQQADQKTKLTWLSNLDDAISLVNNTDKEILVYFSGSDWCRPCMLLRLEVFDTELFKNFAQDSLVLVQFDFPARAKNKLSEEQQRINDQMAERFNKDGVFPKVLLLDNKAQQIVAIDGYKQRGADEFLKQIRMIQKK